MQSNLKIILKENMKKIISDFEKKKDIEMEQRKSYKAIEYLCYSQGVPNIKSLTFPVKMR